MPGRTFSWIAWGRGHTLFSPSCRLRRKVCSPPPPSGKGLGEEMRGAQEAVLAIYIDQPGLVLAGLGFREHQVAQDNHRVPGGHQAGGGAVDGHLPWSPFYGIGLKAGPIVHVQDLDLLKGEDVCRLQELTVYGDAALVVHIHPGDPGPVDLALQHGPHSLTLPAVLPFPGPGPRPPAPWPGQWGWS